MMEEGQEEEEEKKGEEEPKKETDPPQFELLGVTGELCPEGLMTGTHIQIYVQDGSVLTFIPPPAPPPSLPPQLLQPKEEEEALEIDTYMKVGVEGVQSEEEEEEEEEEEKEECREGVTERGKYYDMEVEVLGSDSDERTLALSSLFSEVTDDDVTAEVTGDVKASDLIYEPPECISLLSSMADTMVHIQPDRCFYITVQSRLLPDTHTLYHTHTQRITHLSQVVSLLLELERLIICRGSMVRSSTCQLEVRSPTCHLLVAPPFLTCLPCLLEEEGRGGRG
ncbi:uncharacterized protein LOC130174647 isoform X2 [Seriola aureovittata]|uniref:uncharacterized protein LOC130174647 isoform X2 n=1 Tax=Seriola aureovittata TaxID=2871759 RepID=UPI0024BEF605|nr:uncharacterized protein LOC130174647 isoform X2 [Seriola aureovittata]